MSWVIEAIIWSRVLIFAILGAGITGSVFYLMMRIVTRMFKVWNPYLLLYWQKAALCFYAVPVVPCAFFLKHVVLPGGTCIVGVFWTDRLWTDDAVCRVGVMIWLGGFLVAVARTLHRQKRLDKIWQKNEPVDCDGWLDIFEEYKQRFGISHVRLYQNPLVVSPVVTRRGHLMIVLPEQAYTEKELHMILTHELNHIRSRDLLWRKVGMLVGWINWYLPLPGLLQKELVYQQEVICDLHSGIGNPAFTQKEYGQFLVRMTDNGWDHVPMMALCESEHMVVRRLEMMIQAKKMKKTRRWFVATACAGLAVLTLIPSVIASAQVIAWEEGRIYGSEVAFEDEPQEWVNLGEEEHTAYADLTVTEIDLSKETAEQSGIETISRTIAENTRVLYQKTDMSGGSSIMISVACEDEQAVYRIGIKNNNTGRMTYIEGRGVLAHVFSIPTAGNYSAYVENCSRRSIKVTGFAEYK